MTVVDFLRHGETETRDTLLGRTDAPLCAAGCEAVARQIAGRTWGGIVASPLKRARETAEILALTGEQSVEVDPDWREIDFGDWDGRPRRDLAEDARLAAFYKNPDANPPPNGESMDAVRARVASALDRLAAKGDGPVLVVAHGGSIRMALSILLAIPLERLWAVRIACATLIRVEMGTHPMHGLWGEIIEITQPPEAREA
ncbi:histidine phosphatase family protein [Hyphomicrobium sp.]|uniref:histidine phosphatase family protein n=1 Tax=Hyphomicrobium sp. TaxID=82 RepID=UPI0025BB308C|nr:histidine phosphatase family protein [Hyphomicrobium sp.]MCC7254201.1 histidine phosphatase family protein [Hyphomicrobium sp.]